MSIGEYDDAIDTLNHALTQRPDHPSSYHLLAIAYIKDKQYKAAAGVALKGINFQFDGRFGAVHDILYDDLDLAYSLAMKTDYKDKEYFTKIKSEYKIKQLTRKSALSWFGKQMPMTLTFISMIKTETMLL